MEKDLCLGIVDSPKQGRQEHEEYEHHHSQHDDPHVRMLLLLSALGEEEVLDDAMGNQDAVDVRVEEEQHEELVVCEPDAVVDPRTVVVHLEDASVADAAVVAAVRFDFATFLTVSVQGEQSREQYGRCVEKKKPLFVLYDVG